MEISNDKEFVAWGLGIIFTAVFTALGVRRRYWKDNAEQADTTAKHSAIIWWKDEANLQRQRAEKAIDDLNRAMLELGEMRSELRLLRDQVASLKDEIREYRTAPRL